MGISDPNSVFEGRAEKNSQGPNVLAFYIYGLQPLNIPNYSTWFLELIFVWFSSEVSLVPCGLPSSCFLLRASFIFPVGICFLEKGAALFSRETHRQKPMYSHLLYDAIYMSYLGQANP